MITLAMKLVYKIQCPQPHSIWIIVTVTNPPHKPIIGNNPLLRRSRGGGRRKWPFGALVLDEAVPHFLLNLVNCALWSGLFIIGDDLDLHRVAVRGGGRSGFGGDGWGKGCCWWTKKVTSVLPWKWLLEEREWGLGFFHWFWVIVGKQVRNGSCGCVENEELHCCL